MGEIAFWVLGVYCMGWSMVGRLGKGVGVGVCV